MHAIHQCQVAQYHRTTTDGAMRTNAGAASHTHAARHGRVRTHVDVVTNLNQVVQLHTVFNHRVGNRTSVDTGVGTDLHIIANAHCAELLDLDPALVFRGKTKTISPNHHP